MIEKDIEANIIAAIQTLDLPGIDIRGAWQTAAAGEVKDTESDSAPAALFVHVGPRSFETFGVGVCSMDVALSLAVRIDLCPTGAALETYADPIADLLQSWNLTMDCDHPCGMAVEGEFAPGGLQMSGGSGPEIDRDAGVWSIVFNFTLRGAIVPASPTSSQTTQTEE